MDEIIFVHLYAVFEMVKKLNGRIRLSFARKILADLALVVRHPTNLSVQGLSYPFMVKMRCR